MFGGYLGAPTFRRVRPCMLYRCTYGQWFLLTVTLLYCLFWPL
jgi:hypothetical protein